MPCRVGITRNPSLRKQQWENKVVGLRNWRAVLIGSKTDAQQREYLWLVSCEQRGDRGTCHAHPGGGDPDVNGWYVYEFDYFREK